MRLLFFLVQFFVSLCTIPDMSIDHQIHVPPARKRRRKSRLDPHFLVIANLLLNQPKMQNSLIELTNLLYKKTGVKVHSSTLCRFIQRHPNLKLI